MVQYDLAKAKAAVQFLVGSSYFHHHHIKKLRNTVVKVEKPAPKTGFGKALANAIKK